MRTSLKVLTLAAASIFAVVLAFALVVKQRASASTHMATSTLLTARDVPSTFSHPQLSTIHRYDRSVIVSYRDPHGKNGLNFTFTDDNHPGFPHWLRAERESFFTSNAHEGLAVCTFVYSSSREAERVFRSEQAGLKFVQGTILTYSPVGKSSILEGDSSSGLYLLVLYHGRRITQLRVFTALPSGQATILRLGKLASGRLPSLD